MLVDTHVVLWWLDDSPRLSPTAREILRDPRRTLWVSIVSVWELAVKSSIGKLRSVDDLPAVIEQEGFSLLPITPQHAWAVRLLDHHHRDPFDRLLVAQARAEGLDVLSADPAFDPYGVVRVW